MRFFSVFLWKKSAFLIMEQFSKLSLGGVIAQMAEKFRKWVQS